jgi:hypothetical protein
MIMYLIGFYIAMVCALKLHWTIGAFLGYLLIIKIRTDAYYEIKNAEKEMKTE